MKECICCKVAQRPTDFYFQTGRRVRQNVCKSCTKARAKARQSNSAHAAARHDMAKKRNQ